MSHRKCRSQFSADGHKNFKNAQKAQLAPVVKKGRLAAAEHSYQKCLEYSKTLDERASSYKHLALFYWWKAKDAAEDVWDSRKAVVDTTESLWKQNEVKESLKKCVEYFLLANDGQLCVNDVEKGVRDIIRWSSKLLDAHPASFTPVMTVVCEALKTSKWGAECYLNLARSIFERGSKSLKIESSSSEVPGQGGYKKCMVAMLKCEEILQLPCFENIDLEGRVSDLKGGVGRFLKDSKAIDYSIDGEAFLEKCVNGEEDMILAAIDKFRLAVQTGYSREYRAFAYSRLGKLHFLRGDEDKAHDNHKRSVDIAALKISSRVESAEWYIYSCKAVEKHRVMEETRRKLTELEDAANTKNLIPFIKYLFEKIPHPNKEPKFLSSERPVDEITAWREAAKTYHPDKNEQESEGWQRLCHGIMEELNKKNPMKKHK